jgi:uncharacterized phage infection (PIP) family protein YhgE
VLAVKQKQTAFLALGALVVALILSISLTACQTVEEKVEEGVEKVEEKVEEGIEKVEEKVVTEAKKLVWNQVSDGLDKLKDGIRNDEGKRAEWAASEVAKLREGLKTALDSVAGESFHGLDWVDEGLQKLEDKLADQQNPDALVEAIDEFKQELRTRLDVSE